MPEAGGSSVKSARIVAGVDGSSCSKLALKWASRQAELTGLPLSVVVAWEFPASYGWAPPWPADYDPKRDAKALVEDVVDEVLGSAARIGLSTEVIQGNPAVALCEESKRAELVVVGSRGHGEFAGMLLGSVSEFLVTHAHCPVVVVR